MTRSFTNFSKLAQFPGRIAIFGDTSGKYLFLASIALILNFAPPATAQTSCPNPLTIITWNIRDFGKSRDASEIKEIAAFITQADILALQEIVPSTGPDAVSRLAAHLNQNGYPRDFVVSQPTTGTKSSRERYAFLWNPQKTFLIKAYLVPGRKPVKHDIYWAIADYSI